MKALSAISCIVLAGCGTVETIRETIPVNIPVTVECKVQLPKKPDPLFLASEGKGLYDRGIALLEELEQTRSYAKELELLLAKCATILP